MNKLGLHIIGGFSGTLGRPRLVKLVDVSSAYVEQVRRAVGPDCLIIVRWVQSQQPLDNPVARAQQFVTRYQGEMLAMRQTAGANTAFEGYNEIPDDQAEAYAAFEVERLRLMHQMGLRTVVGCWSVGLPDLSTWPIYQRALDAMQPSDLVGLHEYWPDRLGISNPWWCGRWQKVPQLSGRPIVVTECGRDVVEGRGQPGWRRTCDAATFLEDLRAYNALLEGFPNVLGATVFSTPGPGGEWTSFDPSPVWPQVVASYSNPQTYPGVTIPKPPNSAKGPDPNVPYWHSDRHGYTPAWVVIHDTEGPAEAALAWWSSGSNPGRSSAHYLVRSNGEVVSVVPEVWAAHHAGGGKWPGIPDGAIGGTSIINLVSIGIELEYPTAPASPPWPEAQLASATKLVRDIAKRYGIPRDHVLRHADVTPQNRSDPRNLDWQAFLDRVFEEAEDVENEILKAAWSAMRVPYNALAAFPRAARASNLGAPLSQERDIVIGGVTYRYQPFAGGVVYAKVGDWGNVKVLAW